jgi:DNA-binding transcriptional regulator GbsR (MarR family)
MTLLKDGFQPLTCKEITERLNKRGVKTSMSIVFRLLEKMTKAKALFKNDVRYSISQSPKAVVEFLAGKEKARTLDDTQSQRIISSITEALFKLEKEAKLVCWNELLDDEEDEVEQ